MSNTQCKICHHQCGPRQANLVLIAYASSEGSGEPAHPRSLPEPPLLAHTSSESRGTFRQKARSLAPLNGLACAVKIIKTECSKTQIRLTGLSVRFLSTRSLSQFEVCHHHESQCKDGLLPP